MAKISVSGLLIAVIICAMGLGASARESLQQDFTFETVVRIGTSGEWHSDIPPLSPQIGDILRFRIYYMNISGEPQREVSFFPVLTTGLEYVNGSTTIYDIGGERNATHDTITTTGLNLGNFAHRAEVYIIFEAEIISEQIEASFVINIGNGGQDSISMEAETISENIPNGETPPNEGNEEDKEPKKEPPTWDVIAAAGILFSVTATFFSTQCYILSGILLKRIPEAERKRIRKRQKDEEESSENPPEYEEERQLGVFWFFKRSEFWILVVVAFVSLGLSILAGWIGLHLDFSKFAYLEPPQ